MSTINVDRERYRRIENGHDREEVDAAFVQRYLDAAPFFDALVEDAEEHDQEDDGTIWVEREDPDGCRHVTKFVPVEDGQR